MTGLRLAQYRIDAELGRGGMGIVYRATDTKLNRTVALKVLPAAALASEDDRARFFREAQAAAQLSHPNVCHVYQVDEAVPHEDGSQPAPGTEKRPFIAMEYIGGETLLERIRRSPLKLTEAVSVAIQVAEALKAAHAKQIVHRDIKSANVMLAADGVAKVLDFGLAKTQASTMLTRQGSTLGTVAYMSPEQARGQEVDGRTDLYSLGTVLFEMLAGRLPFAGDYEQAILYGILNEPPEPLTALRTGVPMDLERLVNKLLTKEADYRYQTAADLIADLKSLDVTGSGHSRRSLGSFPGTHVAAAPTAVLPKWVIPSMVAALVVGIAGTWALTRRPAQAAATPFSVSVRLPGDVVPSHPTISPDARHLAFVNRGRALMVYDFETGAMRAVIDNSDVRLSRFSPDNRWLAFEHRTVGISIVEAEGGTVARLTEIGQTPSWIDADNLVITVNGGVSRISRITQVVEPIWTPVPGDSTVLEHPETLPGGRYALVTITDGRASASVGLVDLETGALSAIREDALAPRYIASGHLLFTKPSGAPGASSRYVGAFFAQPFDVASRTLRGPAVQVLSQRGYWQIGLGGPGHLATTGGLGGGTENTSYDVKWLDTATGRLESTGRQVVNPSLLSLSPDGKWFVHVDGDTQRLLISPIDPARGAPAELVDAAVGTARFIDGGRRVLYGSQTPYRLFLKDVSGASQSTPIDLTPREAEFLLDLTPDGRKAAVWAAADNTTPSNEAEVYLVEFPSRDTLNIGSLPGLSTLRISPDGRWIVYEIRAGEQVAEGGLFILGTDGSGPWRVQTSRGGPIWTADSKSLIVRDATSVYLLPLSFEVGIRVAGAERLIYTGTVAMQYDVEVGGGRLILADIADTGEGTGGYVDLVLHWGERLKREVPVE